MFAGKKLLIGIFGGLFLLLLIVGISLIGGYNSMVDADENVNSKFSQIDVMLASRYQKITDIVASVNGLEEHALDIYTEITEARAAYASAKENQDIEALIEADALQSLALTDLIALVVSEDNPNISATGAYAALIDEISSAEAELAYARTLYNRAVEAYNASVRRFPKVLYASLFGFEKSREYWKYNGTEIPEVDFND